ncbi:lysosomal beta glucosidase-like protein [Tanacetum coccineum]
MLEEKFRDLCEEVSNFVKEIEDVVKEVERLSCKDVAKETVRLLRRGQKRELYKMTCLQMMVDESHLSVREKHTFVPLIIGASPSCDVQLPYKKSDEDMFDIISNAISGNMLSVNTNVFSCTIGQKPRKAKYYLDDTSEVILLLENLAEATDSPVTSDDDSE